MIYIVQLNSLIPAIAHNKTDKFCFQIAIYLWSLEVTAQRKVLPSSFHLNDHIIMVG